MAKTMRNIENILFDGIQQCMYCFNLFFFKFSASFYNLVLLLSRRLDKINADMRPVPRTIQKLQYKLHNFNNNIFIYLYNHIKSSETYMLDQEDSFYKELPFTISPEQAKPNFVILGTGLQECLLAAHFSKIQMKPGLVLDIDRTYGSCLKTVTIKELYALSKGKVKVNLYQFLPLQEYKQRNEKFYENLIEKKLHRGYNIDLQPNFFFASSISCEMLKDADMDKYMDFRLVVNMLHFDGKGFKNVPLSKGKIFESKDLGLLEKKLLLNTFHSLSQIYNKFMNVSEDQNSTKEFDKQFGQVDEKLYAQFVSQKDLPFIKFIQKITKNNKKIMNYIIYILCNYQYDYKNEELPEHARKEYTLGQFILRFGKFLKSCGVYGQCPYLYVDNGIGDVPQAYSRIASIYLSTYILHPKIEIKKIEEAETGMRIYTNLYPQSYIETKQIFYGPTCYGFKFNEQSHYYKEYTLRVLVLCKKIGKQQECPAIIYLLDTKDNQNPVYLFMLDQVSHTCPEGFIIYQFQTVITNRSQEQCAKKIKSYIEILSNARGEDFNPSIQFITAYIRQKRYPKEQIHENHSQQIPLKERILRDHSGIDLDSHFINFKQIVGDHKYYFKKQSDKNNQEGEYEGGGDQTVGLIERLQAIDLNKQDAEEKQQVQEVETPLEAQKEVKQQQVAQQGAQIQQKTVENVQNQNKQLTNEDNNINEV